MFLDDKVVIFDMDGTIVDTIGYWRECASSFLYDNNISLSKDDLEFFRYNILYDSIQYAIDKFNLKYTMQEILFSLEEYVKAKYKLVKEYKRSSELFLADLKRRNIKTVLVTANEREYVDILDSNLSFKSYFDSIYTTSEIGYSKAQRECYEFVATKYNTSLDRLVLFEDSYYAIKEAVKHGITAIGVRDYYTENYINEMKECSLYYIEDYNEILGRI